MFVLMFSMKEFLKIDGLPYYFSATHPSTKPLLRSRPLEIDAVTLTLGHLAVWGMG